MRRMPTVYLGPAPVYAERDVAMARNRLLWMVDTIVAARHEPVYTMTPCRLNGRVGLYARDLLNRSPDRMRLARRGFAFTEPPWVRLTARGTLRGASEEIDPSFLILRGEAGSGARAGTEEDAGVRVRPGLALFAMLTTRLWAPAPAELAALRRIAERVGAVRSADPETLVRVLTAERR